MTTTLSHVILVKIEPGDGNLFIATSDELPGLFLTYPGREQILAELPVVIRALYKAKYDEDVRVTVADFPSDSDPSHANRVLFIAVPAGVLKQMNASD